jgi:hypothetical protein
MFPSLPSGCNQFSRQLAQRLLSKHNSFVIVWALDHCWTDITGQLARWTGIEMYVLLLFRIAHVALLSAPLASKWGYRWKCRQRHQVLAKYMHDCKNTRWSSIDLPSKTSRSAADPAMSVCTSMRLVCYLKRKSQRWSSINILISYLSSGSCIGVSCHE